MLLFILFAVLLTSPLACLSSLPSLSDCIATVYGPITTQGTGILAYQNSTTKLANFRISATGVILELDHTFKIVKKLKLTGYPYKIYKSQTTRWTRTRRSFSLLLFCLLAPPSPRIPKRLK